MYVCIYVCTLCTLYAYTSKFLKIKCVKAYYKYVASKEYQTQEYNLYMSV